MTERVVLAYSGGLDTSVGISWIAEETGAEVVAVAFPPWWSTQQVFLAAGSANAAIVRMTAIPALLVVRPDDNDGLARLRKAGAWLAIDPQAIAACFTTDDLGIGNDLRR